MTHRFDVRGVCEFCSETRERVADRLAPWFCIGVPEAAQQRLAEAERKTANDWSGY